MRLRRLAPLLAAAAVMLVATVTAVAGPVRVGEPIVPLDQLFGWAELEDEQDDEDPDEEWWDSENASPLSIGALIAGLLLWAAALFAGIRLARVLVRRWPGWSRPPPRNRLDDELSIQVTDALGEAADLAAYEAESALPGQASDAVVACWVLLEQAAARVGTPRSAPQTPTEFTVALLAEHHADPDAVDTLLGLYHRARFGSAPLPDEAADKAAQALRRIAGSLAPSARARR
jgi:hypothetical protein